MNMEDWRPTGTGSNFTFGPMMGPGGRVWNDGLPAFPEAEDGPGLEDSRDDILIISGMQNTSQETATGSHSGGIGAFLTNRTVPIAVGGTMGGPSIDFLLHTAIGQDTRRPYFILGGEPPFWVGDTCDSGYPCAVANHITFDMAGRNLPRTENPGEAFDLLFEGLDPAESMTASAGRWVTDTNILDAVHEEATGLMGHLSAPDRPRFEEYLNSVSEVQRRIQLLNQEGGGAGCTVPERVDAFQTSPEGYYYGASVLGNHRGAIDISHQLIALGLQCGSTNVVSFMWGNMTSARNYSFIGAAGGHHDTSHHGGAAEPIAKLKRIGYWEYRRFAEFLRLLKSLPDVDGRTVLDNTLVFSASEISDGDWHNHNDLPVVLAGGAAGFTMGRHLQVASGPATPDNHEQESDGAWHGQLFVSIAQAFGMTDVTSFGERGDGPLQGLIV
jgi:hypothetical protein